jgi:hypothetical protein
MRARRVTVLSCLLGLVLAAMIPQLPGCGQLRSVDAIDAEELNMKATKPYAESYKREFPSETQGVDDHYRAWEKSLEKQRQAASDAQ